MILNIKPMSVNEAWQGKRFKTNEYKQYEKSCFILLNHYNDMTPAIWSEYLLKSSNEYHKTRRFLHNTSMDPVHQLPV